MLKKILEKQRKHCYRRGGGGDDEELALAAPSPEEVSMRCEEEREPT